MNLPGLRGTTIKTITLQVDAGVTLGHVILDMTALACVPEFTMVDFEATFNDKKYVISYSKLVNGSYAQHPDKLGDRR